VHHGHVARERCSDPDDTTLRRAEVVDEEALAPSERLSPFMKPPCVDVVICTSPRVMAIAPASTRTLPPGGSVISPNANAGPELMST
jgi:hypothetical protein